MSLRSHRFRVSLGARALEAEFALDPTGRLVGEVREAGGHRAVEAQAERAADGSILLRHGGRLLRAVVVRQGDLTLVSLGGRTYELRDQHPGRAAPAAGEEAFAVSPMTGLLAKVSVVSGASVAAGGALFVVEAMKMEYVVRSPRAVTVAEVRRKTGDKVNLGEVVVTFAAVSGGGA